MSVTVFYFTGTGNSLVAAQTLANRLTDAQIVPIAGIINSGIPYKVVSEKVVFVFPVYSAGIPAIVARALDLIKLNASQYVAAIANCASSAGAALDIFAAELQRRCGQRLAAGWVICMPNNYTPLSGSERPETIDRILSEADNRLLEIACAVSQDCTTDYSLPAPMAALTRLIWKVNVSFFPYMQKRFRVGHSCTGCGLCARICPVNNIEMSTADRPKWLKKCEQCMACLQHCPVEAIQCFWWTKGRVRYRHPRIDVAQIVAQKTISPESLNH